MAECSIFNDFKITVRKLNICNHIFVRAIIEKLLTNYLYKT